MPDKELKKKSKGAMEMEKRGKLPRSKQRERVTPPGQGGFRPESRFGRRWRNRGNRSHEMGMRTTTRSNKFKKYGSVDLQAKCIEPNLTEVARRWKSGKKPGKEKRQQRQQEEEMAKAVRTRTPAATVKSVKLDERTSAKVIRKRVKEYSFDEENC